MAKKRTRASKIRAGFKVSFGSMEPAKVSVKKKAATEVGLAFFRSDLTKVALLTMLALALEIALWLYLPR